MFNFFRTKNHIIKLLLEQIIMNQEEALAKLNAISAQLDQINAALLEATSELSGLNAVVQEQNTKIIDLQTAVNAAVSAGGGDVSPEMQAALDAVSAKLEPISVQAQALADLTPNVVAKLEAAANLDSNPM
jgi:phage-related protein